MADIRAIFSIAACIIVSLAGRCPAKHVIEEPPITSVAGELDLLDPANGTGKVLLKVDGEALGKPVIVGKTLYVATSHTAYALDAHSGEKKWQFQSTATIFGLAATPQQIFIGSAGTLIALEPAAGKTLWKYDGDLPITNLTLADGLAIFNCIDGPVAVDQQTGKLRWRLTAQWGYFVFSPLSEGRLCVWKPDEIFVVETEKGKTLWQSAADQSVSAPGALPTPAVAAGDLICQLRGSPRDADDWSLYARDIASGRQIWRTPLGQREATGAKTTLAGKYAFCVLDDQLSAVDIADGKLKWQTTVKPMEAGGAGLQAGHGLVYIPQLGGELTALDEKSGSAIWIAGAPQALAKGQIRFGGVCVSEDGVYITRNEQARQ